MSFAQVWERTSANRSWWIAAAGVAIVVVAVFVYGLVNMVGSAVRWVSAGPAAPDPVEVISAKSNDAALVGLFAKYCVKLWASATPATVAGLDQCVTVPPLGELEAAGKHLPSVAATVSDLDVYEPQQVYVDDELSLWNVLVAATVKEFAAPQAQRLYYWLPVSLPVAGGPRAMSLPDVRAAGLPGGVDMELAYTSKVSSGSALYGVVEGFLSAYLHGPAADVVKYVTPESRLTALGPLYGSVSIVDVRSDTPVDSGPEVGQVVHVLATVVVDVPEGGPKPMQYPLRLVDAAGLWAVDGLDDIPATTGRMLSPGR